MLLYRVTKQDGVTINGTKKCFLVQYDKRSLTYGTSQRGLRYHTISTVIAGNAYVKQYNISYSVVDYRSQVPLAMRCSNTN